METRTYEEYKLYVLYLAHMKGGVDNVVPIACSPSKQKLEEWVKEQLADKPYTSKAEVDNYGSRHKYSKVYKVGGPLEWYNPPEMGFGGIKEHWVRQRPDQSNLRIHFIDE